MSQKTVKDDDSYKDSYKAHSQAELPEASLGNAHARGQPAARARE